ncbi:MAG: hypothetical protein DHS20C04_29770 [Hyphococcus sp.]|nr:MAG: hypothetical protein DHS20C04_29770 [Marinicaulis sp.]
MIAAEYAGAGHADPDTLLHKKSLRQLRPFTGGASPPELERAPKSYCSLRRLEGKRSYSFKTITLYFHLFR